MKVLLTFFLALSVAAIPRAFLDQHCVSCHGPDKQKGRLRLDTLANSFADDAGTWIEVRDKLNLGEMPPDDEPQPPADEVLATTRWIAGQLRDLHALSSSTGGEILMRRLSRTEYNNTVRDLLRVTFEKEHSPADLLPPDGTLDGIDKMSKALLMDPSLTESYFQTAEMVAERAIRVRPPRVPSYTQRFEFEDVGKVASIAYQTWRRQLDIVDGGVLMMSQSVGTGGPFHPYNNQRIPVAGTYSVRIRAGAFAGDYDKPIYLDVTYRAGVSKRFRIDASIDNPEVYEWIVSINPTQNANFEISSTLPDRFNEPGWANQEFSQSADALFTSGKAAESLHIRAQIEAEDLLMNVPAPIAFDTSKVAKIFLDYLEVEGPLQEPHPPASTRYLLPEINPKQPVDRARQTLRKLLPRAFRRPLLPGELDAHLAIIANELDRGKPYPEAFKVGLIAILCSPHFLYLFEPAREGDSRTLTPFEQATRLSYFLWSSMPDEALFGAAIRGEPLLPHVDRMLADPKAEALVADFASQWLRIAEFDRFKPDRQIYRDSYYGGPFAGIARDMEEEARATFREILQQDLDVRNFLDSDWIMANARLAKYYGIEDVNGEEFRRVALPAGSPRGGIIGMAGVHKWGADGNRTKPVERGKYILSVLFNDPPDPPPPNAGEVEPNVQGQNLTVRERLLKHQTVETCAGCHRGIDPYGLAMENFNAVGRWRDKQDGEKPLELYWGNRKPIINEGTLPNGKAYANFAEFKALIVAQGDRFERGLAERLLTYALGRSLEPTDDPTVAQLVQQMQQSDHTLRGLIHGIVRTKAFASK